MCIRDRDGTSTSGSYGLIVSSPNVAIRGLSINSFDSDGIGVGDDNLTVQGNYLGTDPTGLIDKGNSGNGIANFADGSENLLVGGLDAKDRKQISGNETGGSAPNTDSHNWTHQGNYIGVDATGLVAIPNAQVGGSGALSLDNSNGHVVGGPEITAINVIGENLGHGIAPHNGDGLTIEGNYIGLGYDGTTVLGSTSNGGDGAGITFSDICFF